MAGAGKRILTGESLFMTAFTHMGSGKSHVTFAAPYPGKIIPLDLSEISGDFMLMILLQVMIIFLEKPSSFPNKTRTLFLACCRT